MKKLKTILRITKSQGEVLMAIMGMKRLPYKRGYKLDRLKRHEVAIQQLKDLRMIEKDEFNRLKLLIDERLASDILIENNIRP